MHKITDNLNNIYEHTDILNYIRKAAKGHRESKSIMPGWRQGWSVNYVLILSKVFQCFFCNFHSVPEVVQGLFTYSFRSIITHSRK